MFRSIRSKLLLLVAMVTAFAVIISTYFSQQFFKSHYADAVQSNALAIGRILELQLEELLHLGISLQELTGFEQQCQSLRDKYADVVYAAVQDSHGKLLFHSAIDRFNLNGLIETPVGNDPGRASVNKLEVTGHQYYDAYIPVHDKTGEWVGGIRIGIPQSLVQQKIDHLNFLSTLTASVIIILSSLLLLELIGMVLTRPLENLAKGMQRITSTGLSDTTALPVQTSDEVGKLTETFNALISQLHVAQKNSTKNAKALENLAHYDVVTNLPNRSYFFEQAQRRIDRSVTDDSNLILLFIDIDRFKRINDTYGHGIGDKLLAEVADRLAKAVRSEDLVARLSGDEFVAVLDQVGKVDHIGSIALKILKELKRPILLNEYHLEITASIGIAMFPDDGPDLATLLSNADIAMYQAKQDGRNGYRFFDDAINAEYQEYLTIESQLRQALNNGEVGIHLQPKYFTNNESISGFEALARWQPKEIEQVSTSRFIEVAEESGLIIQLGNQVLQKACDAALKLQQAGFHISIAVNLSIQQLRDRSFTSMVLDALSSRKLKNDALELEITERAFYRQNSSELQTLQLLNNSGIRISIDDFGTGYSSLSRLNSYPVNRLKIDRSFIADMVSGNQSYNIVSSIVMLSHNLGLDVIAEGVEREEQLNSLRDLGVEEAQGFLFNKAMPFDEIMSMLTDMRFAAH